ncbi:DUF5999 family protein [Streptomyces sp. NPDC002838]|uniref:DUF5999 family protein n=1 Tax=Streptomyces sp. NPDC002838 TaxID=3154436 RepID=UPI0033333226
MCAHTPPCPTAEAPDREAARPIAPRPEQGWCVSCTFLLCNGVLQSEDMGEVHPDLTVAPRRRIYGTRKEAAA